MLIQLSVTPVGTGEETKEITAKMMKIIKMSELDYQLTSMGIIIEGDWDELIALARKCHEEVKKYSQRVVTSMVIDDRKDLNNRLKNNVLDVEYAFGDTLETNGLTS